MRKKLLLIFTMGVLLAVCMALAASCQDENSAHTRPSATQSIFSPTPVGGGTKPSESSLPATDSPSVVTSTPTSTPTPTPTPTNSEASQNPLFTEKPDYNKLSKAELPRVDIKTENGVAITSKENYVKSTISLSGCEEQYIFTDSPAGVRVRGNSTAAAAKNHIELNLIQNNPFWA